MSGRTLTVFSRPGCHLCELLVERIEPLCRASGIAIRVVDVDGDEGWRESYGARIPVVCDGETELGCWPVDMARLEKWIRGETIRV